MTSFNAAQGNPFILSADNCKFHIKLCRRFFRVPLNHTQTRSRLCKHWSQMVDTLLMMSQPLTWGVKLTELQNLRFSEPTHWIVGLPFSPSNNWILLISRTDSNEYKLPRTGITESIPSMKCFPSTKWYYATLAADCKRISTC
jgi:hypothetical protein